mmetsp:Transcript_6067/g.23571  ORF Transcript_6067/g.23571 Transcript_6067/m.23571 type:complete len:726 (+) Transcript_6067:309-2486(+)
MTSKLFKKKSQRGLRGLSLAPDDMTEEDFDEEEEAFQKVKQRMNAGDRFLAAADGRWWRRGFNNIWRYLETFRFVVGLALLEIRAQRSTSPAEGRRLRGKAARFCRRGLLQLGPTFIKAGQIVSTRIDAVPAEYIQELSTLQDSVPVSTTSGAYAKRVIRRELKKPVEELFSDFEEIPFASASLGQVHRATEKGTGRTLAIKVQRAGIAKLLEVDLKTLRIIARLANRFDPNADGAKRDWVTLCEQSAAVLLEECDYRLEANNAMAFARNFEGIEWVKVPDVLPELSSRRVLTMEYVPGIKINSLGKLSEYGVDTRWCAARVSDAYLLQLCRHGFFHCDPHPGNIAVLPPKPQPVAGAPALPPASAEHAVNAEGSQHAGIAPVEGKVEGKVGGKVEGQVEDEDSKEALSKRGFAWSDSPTLPTIVWYDFGMVRALGTEMRKNIVDLVVSIYDNDPALATSTLFKLNAVAPGTDAANLRRFAKTCLTEFTETLDTGATWLNQGTDEEQRKELRKRRAKLGADLLTFGSATPLVVPPSFALIFRALTTLDGLGKTLDSKYDLTRLSRPFIRELVVSRNGGAAVYVSGQVLKKLGLRPVDISNFLKGPRMISRIDDFCSRLENGEAQLQVRTLEAELALQRVEAVQAATFSTVLAAAFLNAAMLMGKSKAVLSAATLGGKIVAFFAKVFSLKTLLYVGAAYNTFRAVTTMWKLKKLKSRQRKLGLLSD